MNMAVHDIDWCGGERECLDALQDDDGRQYCGGTKEGRSRCAVMMKDDLVACRSVAFTGDGLVTHPSSRRHKNYSYGET